MSEALLLQDAAMDMIGVAASLAQRGWLLGTSGSLSVRAPTERGAVLITVSGTDKSELGVDDFVLVRHDVPDYVIADPKRSSEALFDGDKRPSGETLVHRAIYGEVVSARAILHIHSVSAVVCSELATGNELPLPAIEMRKGLGHWDGAPLAVPVVPNHAHIPDLAAAVAVAAATSAAPGVLVAEHGTYVWGPDLARAKRHVESFEFIFDVMLARRAAGL